MTVEKPVFVEKQYLGREWIPVTIRLVLATFCFAAYTFDFFSDEQNKSEILAVVGFGIIIISIIMGFLLHFRTRVYNQSILIDGLWTTRLVKIDEGRLANVQRACRPESPLPRVRGPWSTRLPAQRVGRRSTASP